MAVKTTLIFTFDHKGKKVSEEANALMRKAIRSGSGVKSCVQDAQAAAEKGDPVATEDAGQRLQDALHAERALQAEVSRLSRARPTAPALGADLVSSGASIGSQMEAALKAASN